MAQIHPLKTKTKLISRPGVRRGDSPSIVHLHSKARGRKQIQAILSLNPRREDPGSLVALAVQSARL